MVRRPRRRSRPRRKAWRACRRCGQGGPSGSPAGSARWFRGRHWRRAACRARLLDRIEDRPILARPGVERAFVERGRRSADRCRIADRAPIGVEVGRLADVQGFLNGGKRDFSRVFDLFGIVRHVQSEPSCYFYASGRIVRECPGRPKPAVMPARRDAAGAGRLVRHIRKHPIGKAMRMKWSRLRQS